MTRSATKPEAIDQVHDMILEERISISTST